MTTFQTQLFIGESSVFRGIAQTAHERKGADHQSEIGSRALLIHFVLRFTSERELRRRSVAELAEAKSTSGRGAFGRLYFHFSFVNLVIAMKKPQAAAAAGGTANTLWNFYDSNPASTTTSVSTRSEAKTLMHANRTQACLAILAQALLWVKSQASVVMQRLSYP